MYHKLKYLYCLPILVACLMSSCNSDMLDSEDVDMGTELSFDIKDLSRASVTREFNQFAVYGDTKFKDYDPTVVFDKTIVRYQNNKWSYDGTQYWFPKHLYSFVAIYPDAATGMTEPVYLNSQLSFTYTLPDDYKSAADLMVATHRRFYDTSSSTSSVKLSFGHILSRINFLLKNDGAADIVRVTKIELEGVNRTGSFSITPASLSSGSQQTDDYVFPQPGISDSGTITANIMVDVPETKQQPLFPDDDALFLIPQPDNNGVIMHITYTMIEGDTDNGQLTLTASAPIGGWEPGKIYTYSMTVAELTREISLTVSVKPWQTPKPTDVQVPES